jgi:phospholipid/cholesterol/gamma-HCH transport system permease protein
MEMMAVDPVREVVVPRFLAGVISMPLLTGIFNALGILGGYLVGVLLMHVDISSFWSEIHSTVDLYEDFRSGVIKSFVFGIGATLIAVFEGFYAQPTAEGVSRATTRTVVNSAVLVLALDYLLTALMF